MGATLIHYFAALNYHEMIQVLSHYGANLSLKTSTIDGQALPKQELTPLMIAAARGNEKTVKKLMRLGASLTHSISMKVSSEPLIKGSEKRQSFKNGGSKHSSNDSN